MNKIKAWILRHIFKVAYYVSEDISEKIGCRVLARHNLKTGIITIIKITYF